MKTRLTVLVCIAVLAACIPVYAAGRPGPGGPGGPGMGPGGGQNMIGIVLHELDLTDAQRQQVQEIAAESKTKLESARSAVRKAQKALDDAVINDGNEAAIRSAATALGTAQGDEAVLRAQTLIKIKAVLTSDQVAELKELLAKPMPPRQGKRCENGEPNGPPEGAPEF